MEYFDSWKGLAYVQRRHGGASLGLFLILVGCFGLAANFGYLRFSVEMVAGIPLFFGCLLLVSVFTGNKSNLFPALLFILISVPLYFTLAGYNGDGFWPFWVLAPGLAFLGASLLGGAWGGMVIPGVIITGVGLFFLGQERLNLDWQLTMSIGLLALGTLMLFRSRKSGA